MRPSTSIVAALQRLGDHRVGQLTGGLVAADQFIRGQTWPSGSIGSPHKRQAGRPAETRSRPRVTNAATCARVSRRRTEAPSSSSSTSSSKTHHDAVGRVVVGDPDRPDDPRRLDRLDQLRVADRQPVGSRGQVAEESVEVFGECRHLLLLAAQGDDEVFGADLHVEGALPGRADGACAESIRLRHIKTGHGFRVARSPVVFTASTVGPASP